MTIDTTPAVGDSVELGPTRVRRLLAAIDLDPHGWNGRAGRELLKLIRDVVDVQERRFRTAAGDLGGSAVSDVWEALERWRGGDRSAEPAAILYKQAQRRTASAAAAAQTGLGSSSTAGLVSFAKTARLLPLDEMHHHDDQQLREDFSMPGWMRLVGVMLVKQGWRWRIPPRPALAAAAEAAAHSGRRTRSALAGFDALGIPAATWTALELLAVGSGPGCRPELGWPGAHALARRGGLKAVRTSTEVRRLVAAAVAGSPVRTGRDFHGSAS